jgi:hypothetical protein
MAFNDGNCKDKDCKCLVMSVESYATVVDWNKGGLKNKIRVDCQCQREPDVMEEL